MSEVEVRPDRIALRIAALDESGRQQMAANGKKLVFEGHDKVAWTFQWSQQTL